MSSTVKRTELINVGNPCEIPRPTIAFNVKLGGRTEG
jgi:hypothetical protein